MTKKILLIEDDAKLAGMVKDYLGESGFDVTVAGTGNQGLARARYDTCMAALDAAIEKVKPGNTCADVHHAAGMVITLREYAQFTVAVSETVAVTENGCKTVSDIPRDLVEA